MSPYLNAAIRRAKLPISVYWEPINGFVIEDSALKIVVSCRLSPQMATSAYKALCSKLDNEKSA